MQAKGVTHRGLRDKNEDSFLVELEHKIFAVADGMGGHKAGEVASALAVKTVKEYLLKVKDTEDALKEIEAAVKEANKIVYSHSCLNPKQRGMGTTLTVLWVIGMEAYVAHVGDSRAYLLRDGKIALITSDHSFVQELVREGSITEKEARVHPRRNLLTRAVGIERETSVDVINFPLKKGDYVLLCTDGLSGTISDEEIRDIVYSSSTVDEACEKLVETARSRGGEDNITSVLVYID
ncbi:MAG TPA: Stp1/IreP family PP2C-type Ser/Thr phosphatase [Peptococcaceae bacterium]|nr:MAG: Protein serine/threonine phosphatase [Clostridia bacterium 41_269]HBT20051.1 Stp1/IreP family PP2C-type Ser/Thr phosphatase [Peptococcaceae bacterium]